MSLPRLVIGADFQTAGRGRRGRTWTADAGAALLLSAPGEWVRVAIPGSHSWSPTPGFCQRTRDLGCGPSTSEADAGLRDDEISDPMGERKPGDRAVAPTSREPMQHADPQV